ncbi:hypothetical protein BGZ61DRAFT_368544 [Ilyonectria robusta]|uniref:uncharacterized protein n=1 Tax=Ilyonectria robusta TaxID=1079257 RepID=UPI001E8CF2F5|nr:uncharacterized protein BGZ61DRAFT_368544 [Ilyonectria robusta]KAH8662736.1 hypothetical protein BGZ61DRAFT_368544 [Ilyonectria robusta]
MRSIVYTPLDTRQHGDPNLLCAPPTWMDYLIFFGANYLAHAVTLIGRPGATTLETFVDTANALFIPGSGALRAVNLLVHCVSICHQSSLDSAAKAGALCMVVKEKHLPRLFVGFSGEQISETGRDWFSSAFRISGMPHRIPLSRAIFGTIHLPEGKGYTLIEVPPQVLLRVGGSHTSTNRRHRSRSENQERSSTQDFRVPATRDIPRILASILQILWGIVTLYKTGGNQIQLYGYGAFGLTVAPYAIMSFLNLATHLMHPNYSTMYLVHTQDMEAAHHAENVRGHFAGWVAHANLNDHPMPTRTFLVIHGLGYLAIVVTPIIIVGALTGFESGTNVIIRRSWILGWLIVGSASSPWVSIFNAANPIIRLLVCFPLWIPAIGGMVVVGQMLNDFGICKRLD